MNGKSELKSISIKFKYCLGGYLGDIGAGDFTMDRINMTVDSSYMPT